MMKFILQPVISVIQKQLYLKPQVEATTKVHAKQIQLLLQNMRFAYGPLHLEQEDVGKESPLITNQIPIMKNKDWLTMDFQV